ncbi:hypothetical protein BXT86_05940 [candidate division WOR-3 bacterium 4484_100]|uniref:Fibronectin type-III domain-containing protein n=1 Tax=candidate division WOR-3 bacterium 4484_100 TaxID=1936077 RepID=A0A1V4QDU6_UNCW3|nr:MAG: hypothetical protein BXT86_05940 [candidate division WOR-3 bacterium 4484_100]
MKRLLALAVSLTALLILIGCEGEVTLETPSVTYTVTDNGATLRLSWIEISDADGYYIYADGVAIDTIDDPSVTTYDATQPAAIYEVSAYAGEDESDKATVDCTPVKTSNLTVYGLSDPDTTHPSGLAFTNDGVAYGISVKQANYPDLDYIFDDANFTTMTLTSPNSYSPVYNDKKDMALDAQVTSFDTVTIADAPGNYSTQTTLSSNAVYYLFMDQDDDGWDTDSDHFGKMKVESISGSTVTITVAYQPITGLRWLVTK